MAEQKAPLKLGEKLIEGKTKIVSVLPDSPDGNHVFIQSKDRITAGDGARSNDLKGKAELSNATCHAVFELLSACGVKTHFVENYDPTSFIAVRCEMIPLEVVTRRIATGSFLKRNPGVKEGYRFAPLKLETFFKDDANHDPQWSREQCIENALQLGGVTIGERELDIMGDMAIAVFEILEKAWATLDCSLVDMKVEFGVNAKTGEILLGDVIDNDSWRLWPSGDRTLMKDKQVYRELKEVTEEALQMVKRNFQWVVDHVQKLSTAPYGQAVIIMGSPSDAEHCKKIAKTLKELGVNTDMRVSSAHKGTEETINILRKYESQNIPTVFIAVAGRSNGLGPVLSGNTALPVINCPPVTPDWGAEDIWSSLRLPSGLGCTTVIGAEASGLAAAQILAVNDHMVWCRLRAKRLNTAVSLRLADKKINIK